MKRLLSFVFLFMLCFSMISFAGESEIKIYLNGTALNVSVPPVIEDGTTLVPMRNVFEALGLSIDWNDATKTVVGSGNNIKIQLTIGSKTAYVNGQAKELSVPAKIINGSTMVPIRFVSESVGLEVNWDPNKREINIGSKGSMSSYRSNAESMYTVAGTGEYAGYTLIKGHPDEDKFDVYFKGNADAFSVKYHDKRKISMDDKITWSYGGVTYQNTRRELYSFFEDTSWFLNHFGIEGYILTQDWYFETFGDVYWDWAVGINYASEAARVVERYFAQSGQSKIQSNVTLTPDAKFKVEQPD